MSEKHEILSNAGSWAKEFNSIAVCGKCDSGCGQDASTWYGNTSIATCGRASCVSIQDDAYNALCRAVDLESTQDDD